MIRKIKRIYVDSSAVGGKLNARLAEQTKPFWDAVEKNEVIVILSDVLDRELQHAPKRAQDFVNALSNEHFEYVLSILESNALAERYIAENVVGASSLDDCRHIALATLAHADVLVSWNFKHIVNDDRIRGYNSVNIKLGYGQINIRTPYEVISDE